MSLEDDLAEARKSLWASELALSEANKRIKQFEDEFKVLREQNEQCKLEVEHSKELVTEVFDAVNETVRELDTARHKLVISMRDVRDDL